MSTGQRIVLFDLFGVIALHQRPGALAEMAASCHAPAEAFAEAYWALRPPYDAARHSAPQYWTADHNGCHAPSAAARSELRLADIDSWSRVDDHMVAYVQSCAAAPGRHALQHPRRSRERLPLRPALAAKP